MTLREDVLYRYLVIEKKMDSLQFAGKLHTVDSCKFVFFLLRSHTIWYSINTILKYTYGFQRDLQYDPTDY